MSNELNCNTFLARATASALKADIRFLVITFCRFVGSGLCPDIRNEMWWKETCARRDLFCSSLRVRGNYCRLFWFFILWSRENLTLRFGEILPQQTFEHTTLEFVSINGCATLSLDLSAHYHTVRTVSHLLPVKIPLRPFLSMRSFYILFIVAESSLRFSHLLTH